MLLLHLAQLLTAHVSSYLVQDDQIYELMSGTLIAGIILGSILLGKIGQKLSISKIVLFKFIATGLLLIASSLISIWNVSYLVLCIGLFMTIIDSPIDSWCLRIIPKSIRNSFLNMEQQCFR